MKKLFLYPDELGKVIVLAPHCDDEAVGCGGMILRCLQNGNPCKVIFFTNESKDGKLFRHFETLNAWKEYPQLEHIFLNIEDSKVSEYTDMLKIILAPLMESFQPDSIFLPWPVDRHSDHRATVQILSQLKINMDKRVFFYEVFFPLYSNCTMNITNVFEEKKGIVDAYVSQQRLNLKEMMQYLNMYRAVQMRLNTVKAAEAFYCTCVRDIEEVINLAEQICINSQNRLLES